MRREYGLYENGQLVFKGTANEISDKFYMDKNNLYNAYHHGTLFVGKYNVDIVESKPSVYEKKMTKFEQQIFDIVRMLKIYGNTTLPRIRDKELNKYLDALKEQGYDLKVTTYRNQGQKEKYITDYIVEVI